MASSCENTAVASPLKTSKKILCVGIVCLDIIHTCQRFPTEDSTERSVNSRWQRGGNASNTCTVLSLLGQSCEILARLSENCSSLQENLDRYKIDYRHCPIMPKGSGCPVSTVILNLNSGSRTIIHHKSNLTDLTLMDFEALNLEEYSLIHFEGRNLDQVLLMIRRIENYNNSLNHEARIIISVELERTEPELLELLPHADVVFIAKDFAMSHGWNSMDEVARKIDEKVKTRAIIISAWAEKGAIARTVDGVIVQSPAFVPLRVVDTLGAGDTFNAAVLYSLHANIIKLASRCKQQAVCANDTDEILKDGYNYAANGPSFKENSNIGNLESNVRKNLTELIDAATLQKAIMFACRIAGIKVGLRGYDAIGKLPYIIKMFMMQNKKK